MKLNILGSSSDNEKLQCGHAKCSENNSSSALSPNIWTITFPFDNLVEVSIASNNLLLDSSFNTNLSITTSIVSFLFLSKEISSLKSNISLFILTLVYPSFLKFSN